MSAWQGVGEGIPIDFRDRAGALADTIFERAGGDPYLALLACATILNSVAGTATQKTGDPELEIPLMGRMEALCDLESCDQILGAFARIVIAMVEEEFLEREPL